MNEELNFKVGQIWMEKFGKNLEKFGYLLVIENKPMCGIKWYYFLDNTFSMAYDPFDLISRDIKSGLLVKVSD